MNRALLIAVVLSLAAGFAVYALQPREAPLTPLSGFGGAFNLVDQEGRAVSEKSFHGQPALYFFGFTHCPSICPTTLAELAQRLKELGKDADKLRVVFVTVDPERDTPAVIKAYLQQFDARMIGLTGTPQQVESMQKAFHVFAQKMFAQKTAEAPPSGKAVEQDYSMDHSATVYGANARGEIILTISADEDTATARAKIRRLLNQER